jgi:hypothetical protein
MDNQIFISASILASSLGQSSLMRFSFLSKYLWAVFFFELSSIGEIHDLACGAQYND